MCASGIHRSALFGNFRPSGITPMTVEAMLVDFDRPADDGRIAAVAVLPDAVAENDDGGRSWPIVLGQEVASEQGPLANQLEPVGRDERALKPLRRPSFVADVHDAAAEGGERRETCASAGASPRNRGYDIPRSRSRASRVPTTMMRSGSLIGRPRIRTALTNVKTVALTPMPSASAMTATAVNQRSFTSSRTANFECLAEVHRLSMVRSALLTERRVATRFARLQVRRREWLTARPRTFEGRPVATAHMSPGETKNEESRVPAGSAGSCRAALTAEARCARRDEAKRVPAKLAQAVQVACSCRRRCR